ncbi:NAD(P)-dependent oxidoreductase [Arthrobacter sp. AZCC_0090]|uniref:NAD(P)-dependent oxidoreductase n=1 Tax=Arthrobacter sp. AZCC_0090 TaxID=2735881 RepID=UPI0016126CC4|nr:SDR family oxidoreductase [Arthrobacter sp. AZCC_0090]MBB6406604.1 putative NADH-flavin reductase [Arthrobacter sp. AZCC_0090]
MKIAIFGANGPTGRILTRQVLDAGHAVAAVTRNPGEFPLDAPGLTVVGADVYNSEEVERVVAGQDAVLSTLGVPYGRQPIRVYSEGTGNIMRAMTRHGVRRLVCVSSSATDPAAGPHGGIFFSKVLQPLITNLLGRTLYEDMRRMEAAVAESGLEWTIMRPSGLFETESVTDYRMAVDYLNGTFTSRTDLADSMLRQLSSSEYVRKVAAVATFDQKPSLIRMIAREASSKKSAPDRTFEGDPS